MAHTARMDSLVTIESSKLAIIYAIVKSRQKSCYMAIRETVDIKVDTSGKAGCHVNGGFGTLCTHLDHSADFAEGGKVWA